MRIELEWSWITQWEQSLFLLIITNQTLKTKLLICILVMINHFCSYSRIILAIGNNHFDNGEIENFAMAKRHFGNNQKTVWQWPKDILATSKRHFDYGKNTFRLWPKEILAMAKRHFGFDQNTF